MDISEDDIIELLNSSNISSSSSALSSSGLSVFDTGSSDDVSHHEKINTFMDTILTYSNEDFKKHFRLNRSTALQIIDFYEQSEVFCKKIENKGGSSKIKADKEVYLFLWYMANTEPFRTISNLFGISSFAGWCTVNRVATFIVSNGEEYVKWPNNLYTLASGFYAKSGIPGVIGAIDVCNIKIKAPVHNSEDYFNRKAYYSIKLQAVVDSKKRFLDLYCGEPGSLHDSRMLRRSPLYHQHHINGFQSPFFIIGDSAYPCLDWLVTPYKDNGNLTPRQRKFNHLHSVTRIAVENAFGILKTRFRRVMFFTEQASIPKIVNIVMAACILHNMCIENNDVLQNEFNEIITSNSNENQPANINNNRRELLFNELVSLGII